MVNDQMKVMSRRDIGGDRWREYKRLGKQEIGSRQMQIDPEWDDHAEHCLSVTYMVRENYVHKKMVCYISCRERRGGEWMNISGCVWLLDADTVISARYCCSRSRLDLILGMVWYSMVWFKGFLHRMYCTVQTIDKWVNDLWRQWLVFFLIYLEVDAHKKRSKDGGRCYLLLCCRLILVWVVSLSFLWYGQNLGLWEPRELLAL